MKDDTRCPHEADVIRHARDLQLDPALAAHLAGCPACQETRRVARGLQELADLEPVHALPGSGQIWWKAQLLERWDARQRAERPVETMQWIEIGVGLAAAFLLLVWQLPTFARTARLLPTSDTSYVLPALPTGLLTGVAIVGVVLTLSATVFFHLVLSSNDGRR